MPLDLDGPAALPRLAEEVRARFPELNVLMANAGISRTEDFLAANGWNTSDAEAIIDTNIFARGEVLVEYGHDRRTAVREGRDDAVFAAMNPVFSNQNVVASISR